jgi:hypothetical protein
MKNQSTRPYRSLRVRARRVRHLERLSVSAVHMAILHSDRMASLKAMASAIARDESLSAEHHALLRGFEQLSQNYASDARMEMELLMIVQKRHTPEWEDLERRYVAPPQDAGVRSV